MVNSLINSKQQLLTINVFINGKLLSLLAAISFIYCKLILLTVNNSINGGYFLLTVNNYYYR